LIPGTRHRLGDTKDWATDENIRK